MHLRQLGFQLALAAGRIGVDAGNAHRLAAGPLHAGQQGGQLLLELLGAAPDGADVDVAAIRAGARHALGKAAVMAAQRAVHLVEHSVGTAMRAFALPAAIGAVEHRGVAAAVEQQ